MESPSTLLQLNRLVLVLELILAERWIVSIMNVLSETVADFEQQWMSLSQLLDILNHLGCCKNIPDM